MRRRRRAMQVPRVRRPQPRQLLRQPSQDGGPMRSTLAIGALALVLGCTARKDVELGTQSFRIDVLMVNDAQPPTEEAPLPANTGKTNETWDVEIQAIGPDGKAIDFDGLVRVTVQPGAVVSVVNNATGESLGR